MNTVEKFATAMVVERIVVGGAAIIARARCSPVSALGRRRHPCPALHDPVVRDPQRRSASRCGRPAGPDTTDHLGRARTPPSSFHRIWSPVRW